MSQSRYQDELAALKRENRLLLRELDIRQARRDAQAPSIGRDHPDISAVEGDALDTDADGAESIAGPNGRALGPGDRGEQPGPEAGAVADGNQRAGPEQDLQTISETLNRFRATFEDQWRGHSADLGMHLDQLATEVADLRSEVAAARAATSLQPAQADDASHRLILRPAEVPDQEIIVDLTTDGIWQRLRRPWFYLPLLWGLIALTIALGYFAYFAS